MAAIRYPFDALLTFSECRAAPLNGQLQAPIGAGLLSFGGASLKFSKDEDDTNGSIVPSGISCGMGSVALEPIK
jgi:hypothetical protein